ncbi:MAG: glycoside hydrolase family 25 protein [Oscillospiraceae bacterium]
MRKRNEDTDDFQNFEINDNEFQDFESENNEYETADELPPKRHKHTKLIVKIVLICMVIIFINVVIMFATGKLWFNQPEKSDYPIRGVFVDSDLGKIDWKKFSSQNLKAVYIKATEGTAYKDKKFDYNWKYSAETNVFSGAYHVFNPAKSGKEQAEYFCKTIGDLSGRLVPAVEVKLNGIYSVFAPSKETATKNLKEFLDYIYNQYGIKAVIICNSRTYNKYIDSVFSNDEYSICYESFFKKPKDNIECDFWSFSPRNRFGGYENSKEYITQFVFNSYITDEQFKKGYVC